MSNKISPWAVVRESVALSWRRKWAFLGLLLVSLVLLPTVTVLPALARSWYGPAVALSVVLHVLVTLFLMTASNHLAVTMQRGAGTVLPQPFWPAMGRVFVRGLIIVAVMFGVMLAVGVPLAAVAYAVLPHDPADPAGFNPSLLALFMVAGVVVYAFVVGLILRLMVMIPGAAVGHVVGVREALALTRGHAWRMFWSMLTVVLPVMILTGLFEVAVIGSAMKDGGGGIGAGTAVSFLVLLVLDLFSWIVLLVMNAVWYEKLRLRAAAPGVGSGAAFRFSAEPGTAPGPARGAGVGPYADLPEDR
ncbi:hypothetical protein DND132_1777 [Pseudodesulfovibrio mercurii]|uniref:Glycerophosphoryl diester phosphodiesterase membrane domain-containing protein n=1 Tax=Pseudodesulfovibrio mercurii TaxID=641491 RepID=F0JFY7_9BACT|nr:hypothetical protein [Pseudodesulfovibrio mercurii]EGB14983.1 hypothetical protein DND132_1777 [Pseudodesulfovibrio mercurii]